MSNRGMPGPTRRRRRLSDEETGQRMIQAAMHRFRANGLTVSLEHVPYEELIRDAGVTRSAVYRRWPFKDDFFAELLPKLAAEAHPATQPGFYLESVRLAATFVIDRLGNEDLEQLDPGTRRSIMLEVCRLGGEMNLHEILAQGRWQTHLALASTVLSLEPGPLRESVREQIVAGEQGFLDYMRDVYRLVAGALGFRLRPGLAEADGYRVMAALAATAIEGLVANSVGMPAITEDSVRADLFDEGRRQDWTMGSMALTAVVTSLIEPDPHWRPEATTRCLTELAALRDQPVG